MVKTIGEVKITNPDSIKRMDFFGAGFMEFLVIDRWKYKGRGRPRKTDYITIAKAWQKINASSIDKTITVRNTQLLK